MARQNVFDVAWLYGPNIEKNPLHPDFGRHILGKKNSICPFCYASMYLNERTSGTINNPIFSMCCSKGKVDLPQLNPLPTWYSNLIKQIGPLGRHFISKIRLYNSAFAFSSFNAKVLIIFVEFNHYITISNLFFLN